MPYFDSGNGEIYYEVHGSGPALVLAHGMGGNHAIWWRQIEYFRPSYTVVTFDAQGFGLSHTAPRDPAPPQAAVLGQLLDVLGIDEAVLVGQSMGGYAVWDLAALEPNRVRALVMSASTGPLASREEMNLRARRDAVQSATQNLTQPERVFAPLFRQTRPADVLLYTQLSSFGDVTQARLGGARTPMFPASGDDFAPVTVPTLFIAGRHDRLVPIDMMRDVAQLAGASFVELPVSGHSPFFECPNEYNLVLDGFLRVNEWGPQEPDSLVTVAVASAQ